MTELNVEEILRAINNLPIEGNNTNFSPIPQDHLIDTLSPIQEINSNLSPFRDLIRIGHINAVSLPKYRDEIARVLKLTKMDIVAISEHNIKAHTPKHLYKIEGYKLFHVNRENKKCGGVGILVNDLYANKAKKININFKELQPETIFLEVTINFKKLLIGCLYKSPGTRYGVFSDIIEYLNYFATKYENTVFLGDMNIDQLRTNKPEFKFFRDNIINPLALTQLVKTPTRIAEKSSTLIDLILVNSPENVKFTGNTCISGNLDHSMVYCAYALRKEKYIPKVVKRRDFRNFSENVFKSDMQNAPWNDINLAAQNDLDLATNLLEQTFQNAINANAPFREIKITKPINASWMHDEIIFLMDLRDKYRKKWNEIKTRKNTLNLHFDASDLFFERRYKELKNKCNHLTRQAKVNEFENMVNKNISNSKKFHSALKTFNVVRSKNKNASCAACPNKLNECFTKNNNAKVNETALGNIISDINQKSSNTSFKFNRVEPEDIIKTAKTLKSNACGIDEISAFFIKLSIQSSARIFAEIVNASLKSGYFPTRWKKARIKPIPKINEPMVASDYRPISLLIAFSKILEKIVCNQMKAYLITNNILDNFQSAYRAQHSTTTALVDITNNIYKAMDNSEITLLVLLDYSKAFDCANHKLILAKLKSFGFDSNSLKWIKSYLTNRSQQVVTEKGMSNWIELENGVPQGSILGPLLFTILISDISSSIKNCKYHLYADDTQIYISGKVAEIKNLIKLVNEDLNRISQYSVNNCLKLNEGKTVFIIIGSQQNITTLDKAKLPDIIVNNKKIKRERKVVNLGIIFDQYLSWEAEINNTISNSNLKLRQGYNHKRFLSKQSRKSVVQSYILANFNYNSIILQNLTQALVHKLQGFQNTCTRFILNLRKYDHISEGFKSLNMLNMENSRKLQCLTLMHKIVNKKAPKYLNETIVFNQNIHNHDTRGRENLRLPNVRTNFGRNRFMVSTARLYNQLTNELNIPKVTSVDSFKSKIKKHFLDLQAR